MVNALECEVNVLRTIPSSGDLTSVNYVDRQHVLASLNEVGFVQESQYLASVGQHDFQSFV